MIGTAVEMNWDYVAGFFEAGGHASSYHNYKDKHYYSVRVQITQKEPEILEKIKAFLIEEGLLASIYKRPDRESHDLVITKMQTVRHFCEKIFPHLHMERKKHQILDAYGSTALQTKLDDKLIRER